MHNLYNTSKILVNSDNREHVNLDINIEIIELKHKLYMVRIELKKPLICYFYFQ